MNEADDILDDTVSRLFADHVDPGLLARTATGEWPDALWAAVADFGLPKVLLSEAAGGFGLPLAAGLRLLRLAGAAAVPLPLAETVLAGWLLAGAGLSMPEGPLSMGTAKDVVLEPDGAGWRLAGSVQAVPWGRHAAWVVVMAMRREQAFLAMLPAGSATCAHGTNLAGEPRDRLSFDVRLPPGAVAPAASGIGPLQLRAAGAAARSLMIAGALQAVSGLTVAYAQERRQFGKPIGRFQAVQQNLAVLAGEAAAATAASDLAADGFADGVKLPAIAAGKSRAGEAAGVGAALAHQVHGAMGFTYEHRLHFLTKRLWSWRDEYGSEAEWNLLLGRHGAAQGADQLWAGITSL